MSETTDPRIERLARKLSAPVIWGKGYDYFRRCALEDAAGIIALVDSVKEPADAN